MAASTHRPAYAVVTAIVDKLRDIDCSGAHLGLKERTLERIRGPTDSKAQARRTCDGSRRSARSSN